MPFKVCPLKALRDFTVWGVGGLYGGLLRAHDKRRARRGTPGAQHGAPEWTSYMSIPDGSVAARLYVSCYTGPLSSEVRVRTSDMKPCKPPKAQTSIPLQRNLSIISKNISSCVLRVFRFQRDATIRGSIFCKENS